MLLCLAKRVSKQSVNGTVPQVWPYRGLHVLGVRAGGAEMVNKQQMLSDCIESTCELVEDKDFKDEQAQLDALHGLPCTPLVIAGQLAARSNTADPPKQ